MGNPTDFRNLDCALGSNSYSKRKAELDMVGHACNPSYSGGEVRRIWSVRVAHTKVVRLCLKDRNKRTRDMTQMVECLSSMCRSKFNRREREDRV
jgi:hypothetical protein